MASSEAYRKRARCAQIMAGMCCPGTYLAGMPGTAPWDPAALDRFAAAAETHVEVRLSARLLLRIWWLALRVNDLDEIGDERFGGQLTDSEWREIRSRWRTRS